MDLEDVAALVGLLRYGEDEGELLLLVVVSLTIAFEVLQEGIAVVFEELDDFIGEVEVASVVTPEGQLSIVVDGLDPLDSIHVWIIFGDLLVLVRDDIEVPTSELTVEGLRHHEAVVVLTIVWLSPFRAPFSFLLADLSALGLHDVQLTATEELELLGQRHDVEGLVGLALRGAIGRGDDSTLRLDRHLDLELEAFAGVGRGLTVLRDRRSIEALFLDKGHELRIVLDERAVGTDRHSRLEARSAGVSELILDEGHRFTARSYTIRGRVEDAVRELDKRVTTSHFFAHHGSQRSGELQDRQDVLYRAFLDSFDFGEGRADGQEDLHTATILLGAFLSGEDDAAISDAVDSEPVSWGSQLGLDGTAIAGEGDLLRGTSLGEEYGGIRHLDKAVSCTLRDSDTALCSTSIDDDRSGAIDTTIIGAGLDLERIALLCEGEPRFLSGEGSPRVLVRLDGERLFATIFSEGHELRGDIDGSFLDVAFVLTGWQ